MRLFLGIFPPTQISAHFRDTIASLKKWQRNFKFVAVDQIHMTLLFLGGNVSETSGQTLQERFVQIIPNFKSFAYALADLSLGFPRQRKPRVLFYSGIQAPSLINLEKSLKDEVKKLSLSDVEKPWKDFHPHFTIGRLKRSLSKSMTKKLREELKAFETKTDMDLSFRVNEISLIESKLTNKGPVYHPVTTYQLTQ